MKPLILFLALAAALIGIFAGQTGRTQMAGGTSNYIFRFNTGISSTFLSDMTFKSEQPLDLGSCTVTEKVNGPLACAVNCQANSVCLLALSGPSGSGVNDVLEKVSETPVSAASPGPTSSAGALPGTAGFGALILSRDGGASNARARIEAYNHAGG